MMPRPHPALQGSPARMPPPPTDPLDRWPLPSAALQALICLLTFGAAYVSGRVGLAAALLLVSLMPTRRLILLFKQGEYIDFFTVYLATMLVANIDALAALFNDESEEGVRGSWPIVLGTIALAIPCLPRLRSEFFPALLLFICLFAMRVLSAGDLILTAGLKQTSYLFAMVLFLTLLPSKTNREALVEKLVLVAASCAGNYAAEMFSPHTDLSISSTQYAGVVGRAAGLYANSNNAGLILSFIALLTCFTCEAAPRDRRDKIRLIALHFFCLVGIGITFSRQALLVFALPVLIMASKVATSNRGKIGMGFPLILAGGVAILFLGFEMLSATDQGLSRDAKARYASLKSALTFGLAADEGDMAGTGTDRLAHLRESQQYWSNPTLIGLGQDFVKRDIDSADVPHNQFLMILIEDGYLGEVLFLSALLACIGLSWSVSRTTMINGAAAAIALLALAIGTYNMFDFRFLVLPITLLMWAARYVPASAAAQPKKLPLAPRMEPRPRLSGTPF